MNFIRPRSTSANVLNLFIHYIGTKLRVLFKRSYLKQDKNSFNHGKMVNI